MRIATLQIFVAYKCLNVPWPVRLARDRGSKHEVLSDHRRRACKLAFDRLQQIKEERIKKVCALCVFCFLRLSRKHPLQFSLKYASANVGVDMVFEYAQ